MHELDLAITDGDLVAFNDWVDVLLALPASRETNSEAAPTV